ncbi:hypothetical protein A9Q94_09865 [Rhodobacterales bacterium 56_14_T64]|nr:hypothetical protein A9Q94_09865 [Rhodobacterales bacterium 56_14_T64]
MTDLTLLHTAQIHCATFDRLAPNAELHQVVREDWLARAQNGIDDDLAAEITAAVKAVEGPVLCTCTTIGAVAEAAGATRIDWPMMQAAARTGGPVLMVYCLDSTAAPSEALLRRAFSKQNKEAVIRTFPLTGLWRHFSDGDVETFNEQIAIGIDSSLVTAPDTACVVLAQASMAGAAALVQGDVPVLASPSIAIQALLPAV